MNVSIHFTCLNFANTTAVGYTDFHLPTTCHHHIAVALTKGYARTADTRHQRMRRHMGITVTQLQLKVVGTTQGLELLLVVEIGSREAKGKIGLPSG